MAVVSMTVRDEIFLERLPFNAQYRKSVVKIDSNLVITLRMEELLNQWQIGENSDCDNHLLASSRSTSFWHKIIRPCYIHNRNVFLKIPLTLQNSEGML